MKIHRLISIEETLKKGVKGSYYASVSNCSQVCARNPVSEQIQDI